MSTGVMNLTAAVYQQANVRTPTHMPPQMPASVYPPMIHNPYTPLQYRGYPPVMAPYGNPWQP